MSFSPAEMLLLELGMLAPRDIELEEVAASRDVTVRYRNLVSCEARIIGRGDTAVVTIDRRRGLHRARFSLAHELGHWHHHRGQSFVCRPEDIGGGPRIANQVEKVADGYAADLVLPPFMVKAPISEVRTPSLEAVRTVANDFRVSITATALRFVQYHPTPLAVICHAQGRRKWAKANPRIARRLRDELDDRSPAFDVLYGEAKSSRRVRVKADYWFDGHWVDRYDVVEESYRVTDDEIVALLVVEESALLS
ncbi:ImmA/IrrE family metallo-endopeptidase [Magnetospirillum molischianum]|uniref:IrrE N-terminal-like domain-containing protein n=1 Tax=Magnetospirillum molischianum DSM 120 TaxID=1150626 RepID=H8FTA1_MAGML|nr:ImmA/IrrE family metallo-endopeptidase [Magnetospirillum molischianum]CCG41589.1 conserved hypothetical protein [Magnetospirillum molischianum DSM 120]